MFVFDIEFDSSDSEGSSDRTFQPQFSDSDTDDSFWTSILSSFKIAIKFH